MEAPVPGTDGGVSLGADSGLCEPLSVRGRRAVAVLRASNRRCSPWSASVVPDERRASGRQDLDEASRVRA
ncbi:MAG: hypothetical protein QOG10_6621 [Kribbellaceae bacterium]|jgi:hypothetical protein|nr:hypothetical protein [Kribbellaceae bacterium]